MLTWRQVDAALAAEMKDNERQLDRDWYGQEEGGNFVDETHNPFLGEEGDPLLKKREEQMQVGGWGDGCWRRRRRLVMVSSVIISMVDVGGCLLAVLDPYISPLPPCLPPCLPVSPPVPVRLPSEAHAAQGRHNDDAGAVQARQRAAEGHERMGGEPAYDLRCTGIGQRCGAR